jgi:hypothetical protein
MEARRILQQLFELPKYEAQKEFCRQLMTLSNLDELLREVISVWNTIPTMRKDKFFYLVSLLIERVDYDILRIENTELRNYCIRNKFFLDERMLQYIATCEYKSTLLAIRENIYPVDDTLRCLALELGKAKSTKQLNREILYEIYNMQCPE